MEGQEPVLDPDRMRTTARIIHGAITAGVVILFVIFYFLRERRAPGFDEDMTSSLRLGSYAVALGLAGIVWLLRRRIFAPRPEADRAEWWAANMPKAIMVWAVAEACGFVVMVLGWLIVDLNVLVLGLFAGVLLLFATRPGSLAGRG